MPQGEPDHLREHLRRYPVERYPVQHATTQFHLGSVLLQAGETTAGLQALTAAQRLFEAAGMKLEHAKALVMVGVGLRAAGRPEDAAHALRVAGAALADLDAPAERAAASYNLGLVLTDVADAPGAHEAWSSARELFLVAGLPAQAAAAARDHGASLLATRDPRAALPLLELACALSERAGDDRGTATAGNALGLAHLALDDPASATAVLRRALGFVPRTTRPAEHAMVKANLALAHERAGQRARARLAAAQVVAVPGADPLVRAQAQALLTRLPGRLEQDLLELLDADDRESWPGLVREEVARVADSTAAQRQVLARGFLDAVLVRPTASCDLAESLLQVLLELPPRQYAAMVEAIVAACAGRADVDTDRLHAVVGSALARFAMPQWQRLVTSLNGAATASGQPATWR